MKHPGKTPPFRAPDGGTLPGSIAEARYVRLGGLDQWVLIRGESLANPPLIMLHGGPGLPETNFFRHYNAALEKAFTVVYWDQRGSGKSFDSKIPRSSMTTEQFVADLAELVDVTRERTGKDKVAIFGHSWGSVIGVMYAARFPEKVSVYAGSGQIGDWAAGEAASYAFALTEAGRRNNSKALRELRAIGPPPYSASALFKERMWLSRFEGRMSLKGMWEMAWLTLTDPERSLRGLPNVWRGFRFSLDAMWEDVSKINLREAVPALKVPVFFLLGRRDHWVPPETSVAYFEALTAPSKTLTWFEESGHEPFMDEPAKFNAAMVELVRPAADRAGAGAPVG